MKDISVGFTAFQPVHDSANAIQGLSSASVGLERSRGMRGKLVESTAIANYSIEISADSGLSFFAGTLVWAHSYRFLPWIICIPPGTASHVVNAVVTRTGIARTFSVPLNVLVCVIPKLLPKWAVEYDLSDDRVNSGFARTPTSVLRATLDGNKQMASGKWLPHRSNNHAIPVIMPNSTSEEIQASKIVTSTSARFTIPIELDDTHITNFDTYYQTLANQLTITLNIPRAVDEEADLDDPPSEHDFGFGWDQLIEDDEEAWVPWEKNSAFGMPRISGSYSGSVPVAVYPEGEVMLPRHCHPGSTAISDQVVLSDEMECERLSVTHYLDEGARGPTFVDRSAIQALLAEKPAERELRAPVLKPVVSSPPKGEELVYRYHSTSTRKRPIYVGETWAKKVANKDQSSGPAMH